MYKEEPVYVTGHQHPDADSIASAIGYAFFKKAMGIRAIPCRLGDINNETRYLLKRFNFAEPMLLTDARKTLGEIELDPPKYISPETTALEAISMMDSSGVSLAVIDENEKLVGYVSKSDLANIGLSDTAAVIELLKHTPVADMVKVINGQLVYDDSEVHINGKVSIIALTKSKTENYDVKDRIVIVGDETEAQLDLIRKGAGVLVVVWAKGIDEKVLAAAKEHHCPIIISGHGTMNTSRYILLSPPVKLFMTKNPMAFTKDTLVEEVERRMQKTRYKSYPVVDKNGKFVGYVTRYHILGYKNKKIIMVDHNEFSQSARCVEKAQIIEVVDHHRINDFATSQPVSFRNEIVGSTATIIATMFRENQVPLPKELAGLLLGAILSDTLMFQSPTTTKKDEDTANILAALADLDIDTFGKEMFSASAMSTSQSIHEMVVQDIKFYDINGIHTMISQIIVNDPKPITKREKELIADMDELVIKKDLDLLIVAITSIIEDGTIFYTAGEKANAVNDAFPNSNKHLMHKGILSRKGQILPRLVEALER
ncbi:MAG: putative manganese-dependent inorganic diphosphatase [Erysipelotrichaceae bacterium]|nr:putative manganese-dependent inorganic diphosphatase [Erysipelotrichaceae bacterium]